jgi:hypothetical protein
LGCRTGISRPLTSKYFVINRTFVFKFFEYLESFMELIVEITLRHAVTEGIFQNRASS